MANISRVETGKPNPFSTENLKRTTNKIANFVETAREVRQALRPDVGEATVHLSGIDSEAIRILVISDTHLFHEAVSFDRINQLWREIMKPDTFVVLAGDLIEGIKQEYLEQTTSTLLNMNDQMRAFREGWLRKIVEAGKVLAVVTRFGSHDDWPMNKTTINAVAQMMEGLKLGNGEIVPLIWNGGKLNLVFDEAAEAFQINLFHQVGGSGSTINPVKPLRNVFVEQKLARGQQVPMAAVAGHNHGRAGVSSERTVVGVNEVHMVLCQNGTEKGVEEMPDLFLRTKGSASKRSGAAMVLRVRPKTKELQVIPTYGYTRSDLLFGAIKVWNKVESAGTTKEHLENIMEANGSFSPLFDVKSPSATRVDSSLITTPLFRQLNWSVDTGKLGLPVTVYTTSHARFGSSSIYLDHLRSVMEEIAKEPYSMLMILGDMVDMNVPSSPERGKILEEFARTMSLVPTKQRLGVMLSSVLRSEKWRSPIKISKDESSPPIIVSDYLFKNGLKWTPVYEGGGSLKIRVGGVDYWWYLLDGTGNFGSRQDPYLALAQMDKMSMVKNDVVTGGISTIPGSLTMDDRILLSPGWESPAVDRRHGKSFLMQAPKGGQGVVMFPTLVNGEKLIFGGGSFRETRDMAKALVLFQGLSALNSLKKVTRTKGR